MVSIKLNTDVSFSRAHFDLSADSVCLVAYLKH